VRLHGDPLPNVRRPSGVSRIVAASCARTASRRLSVRAAPANEPSPLRRSPHRDQLLPDVPSSDYRRRAQGFSPSPRLHGPWCVPGFVSSRTRPWGFTLQGLHPSQSRDASRHPVALLTFARSRPRPTDPPMRAKRVRARGAPARFHAGGQAPWGAAPDRTKLSSAFARSRRPLARTVPVLSRSFRRFGRPVAVRRTSAGSPSGLFSLQRARSSRTAVTPCRGRGPPGFRLSRALLPRVGVGVFVRRPSLASFSDRVRSFLRCRRRLLRDLPASRPGRVSREIRRPS